MDKKEEFKTICNVAEKVLGLITEYDLPTREKWQIIMDFDNVNKICPLNFDLLLNDEGTLLHDYVGICRYFNRQTLKFDDEFFVPRSALKGQSMRLVHLFEFNPCTGWNKIDLKDFDKNYTCSDHFAYDFCEKKGFKLCVKEVNIFGNTLVVHLDLQLIYALENPKVNQAHYQAEAILITN